ncbi:MAG: hypothetical protein UY81_C0016G0011 [Candidatus Giovannonibacteria bacterium GW2011_GWA2_53_7]|uniref:Uncharacterized protein n=1 Tax=Candidatus Giovannonibacteria bacterium GW2011_GWA2_53_7 TaxID=1618650 RepID=A0A0G1Y0I4_9BACT|nr:MAG: hypothetical protein UY81_C0016G0011 [Candidatus Giovannonibacteria bacterium GW2011_GWA2_53_7]
MLMSLLVLSAITAVAVSMAVIIIKDVTAASNVDHAIQAYYAAESGIEKGLSLVKQGRYDQATLSEMVNEFNPPLESTLENKATWQLTATTNEAYTISFLQKDQSLVLDLYNPDEFIFIPGGAAGGFESFTVEALDANPETNPAWLEISYFPWEITGFGLVWDDEKVQKRLLSIDDTAPNAPTIFNLLGTEYYRIRVKALYDDIKNVKISAYAEDDPSACVPAYSCIKKIPNRVSLSALGTSAANQVRITASVPWQTPVSGIFDYVLFSEQPLDKRT